MRRSYSTGHSFRFADKLLWILLRSRNPRGEDVFFSINNQTEVIRQHCKNVRFDCFRCDEETWVPTINVALYAFKSYFFLSYYNKLPNRSEITSKTIRHYNFTPRPIHLTAKRKKIYPVVALRLGLKLVLNLISRAQSNRCLINLGTGR